MCDSLLDAFSERTLSLTSVDAILKHTAPPPPSSALYHDENASAASLFQNEPSALFAMTTTTTTMTGAHKRKEVAGADDAPQHALLELFATVVEVQSMPTLLLPRYQLLVSDASTFRPALVHFWCGAHEQKAFFVFFFRAFFSRSPLRRAAGT